MPFAWRSIVPIARNQKNVPTKISWSELPYCWFQASCRLGWAGRAALILKEPHGNQRPCVSDGGLVVHDGSSIPMKFRIGVGLGGWRGCH